MAKINHEEYEILIGLDDKWKWIVRNDEWQLEVRKDKPFKKGHVWSKEVTNHGFSNDINYDLFHFIQWNDINGHEEPYSIAELIEEYEESREYKDSLVIEYFMDKVKESEETEVTKNKEGLVKYLEKEISNFKPGQMIYDYLTFILKQLNQLDEPEVLSQEWISDHIIFNEKEDAEYIYADELQNLLVPKQEEVNQAYKNGYEKGKQHTFYKGYLEGLADKEKEPETVADVVANFWKSLERLKEVMTMEVEELEE